MEASLLASLEASRGGDRPQESVGHRGQRGIVCRWSRSWPPWVGQLQVYALFVATTPRPGLPCWRDPWSASSAARRCCFCGHLSVSHLSVVQDLGRCGDRSFKHVYICFRQDDLTDGAGQIARPHRSNKKRATLVRRPTQQLDFFPQSSPHIVFSWSLGASAAEGGGFNAGRRRGREASRFAETVGLDDSFDMFFSWWRGRNVARLASKPCRRAWLQCQAGGAAGMEASVPGRWCSEPGNALLCDALPLQFSG